MNFSDCPEYKVLDEADRNYKFKTIGNDSTHFCDNPDDENVGKVSPKWDGPGWYRFTYPAGEKLSENVVEYQRCGTQATGWMNGTHPVNPGEQVTRTVCFNNGNGNTCRYSTEIKVHLCGSFYVYYLKDTPLCTLRYCAQ